jgi:hypothetical protein
VHYLRRRLLLLLLSVKDENENGHSTSIDDHVGSVNCKRLKRNMQQLQSEEEAEERFQ